MFKKISDNNKSGFTLVEILAVIVILAVILAVSIPSVSGVITSARNNAFNDDAQMVLKAIDYQKMSNPSFDPTILNKDNIDDILRISNDNYELVSVTNNSGRTHIVLDGVNKWNGSVAFGEKGNISVITDQQFTQSYPVITITGSNPINVSVGGTYTDAGATASDSIDGNLTSQINTTGSVNANTIGTYYITYKVTNSQNNTITKMRTINVIDNIIPVITMLGSTPVSINQGSSYTDAGATANDNVDGNITARIQTTSTVNTNVVGNYTVTYTVSDTAGNTAAPVVRTVNVVAVDSTAPTVSFGTNGNATYAKTRNTTVTVSDSGSGVNTSSLKYQWTTSTTPPSEGSFGMLDNIINNPIALSKGNVNISYRKEYLSGNIDDTNSIAFGSDPVSGTFTNGGNVNSPTGVTGGYYLWILAKDNNNNTAITRSNVFNLDNTIPVITMLGSTPVSINQGSSYTDAGATAADNIGGNITASIQTTSTVNTNVVGTYTVTYTVSDSSGNAATPVVRTVNVTSGSTTKTYLVNNGNDDGWTEYAGVGDFYPSYGYIWTGYLGGYRNLWVKWNNVDIPRGSTITSAKVQYKTITQDMGHLADNCETLMYFNDVGNAVAPISYDSAESKVFTSNFTAWDVPKTGTDAWIDSPNISAIIQEIVDRADWNSGQSMMLLHRRNSSTSLHGRIFYSYESGAANAPKLVITYQ